MLQVPSAFGGNRNAVQYLAQDLVSGGLGAACRSGISAADEAVLAEKMGATYVTAGHIFATDCKKGLEPRGIEFLKNAVSSVDIDVYGIGGISPENIGKIQNTGAKGACIMSGFMKCDNVN